MPLFFHLFTNDHFQVDFLTNPASNLLLVKCHYPFDVNQKLLASLFKKKKNSPSSVFFQLTCFSLHRTSKEFLAFIKATVHVFVGYFYYMCFLQR